MARRLVGNGTAPGAAPEEAIQRAAPREPGLWDDDLTLHGAVLSVADYVPLLAEHLPQQDVLLLVEALTQGQAVRVCTDAGGTHADHTISRLGLVDEHLVGWSREAGTLVSLLFQDIGAVEIA